MQQAVKIDTEFDAESAIMPPVRPVDQQSMPSGRLRRLMAAAQEGDRNAYGQFLVEACNHLEDFYTGMLVRSERERIIEITILAIHNKRRTCDTTRSVRPWIEAIAEYRRKQTS